MKRFASIACLCWLFLAPILAWSSGVANNPQSPISPLYQGPDPTGNAGYPLSVVNATGTSLDVNVTGSTSPQSVTQGSSPWVVGFGGVSQPVSGTVTANQGGVWSVRQDLGVDVWRGQQYLLNTQQSSGAVTMTQLTPTAFDSLPNPFTIFCQGNGVPVQVTYGLVWNGDYTEAERAPSRFRTVQAAAAGNTALWTPAAGKKFHLQRYMVTVVDQATQAAPGTLTVSLVDGAAGLTGQVHDVFVPAVGLLNTGSLYSSGWIDLGKRGYISTAANNVLNVNLSAALTAGTVRVICCGTEE